MADSELAPVVPLHGLWTTAELAEMLSFSPRTLQRWRSQGVGPPWFRLGRRVRYDAALVRRWLDDHTWPAVPDREPPVWSRPTGRAVQLRLVTTS